MEYKVLKSKPWVKEDGMLESRVVMLSLSDSGTKYSTHIQCKNEDGSRALFWGHYINDYEDCEKDFNDRRL